MTRLCLEGCDLCAQAAPDVVSCALNGLLIHREKLTDAHFSVWRIAATQALTVCGEGNKKHVDEIMATVLRDKPFTIAAAAVLRFPAANVYAAGTGGRLFKPAMTPDIRRSS